MVCYYSHYYSEASSLRPPTNYLSATVSKLPHDWRVKNPEDTVPQCTQSARPQWSFFVNMDSSTIHHLCTMIRNHTLLRATLLSRRLTGQSQRRPGLSLHRLPRRAIPMDSTPWLRFLAAGTMKTWCRCNIFLISRIVWVMSQLGLSSRCGRISSCGFWSTMRAMRAMKPLTSCSQCSCTQTPVDWHILPEWLIDLSNGYRSLETLLNSVHLNRLPPRGLLPRRRKQAKPKDRELKGM